LPPPPPRARISKRVRSPVIFRQAGNRFLGSLKGLQIQAQATKAGGIDFLESILGSLKITVSDGDVSAGITI
jgi:hypothetical protein